MCGIGRDGRSSLPQEAKARRRPFAGEQRLAGLVPRATVRRGRRADREPEKPTCASRRAPRSLRWTSRTPLAVKPVARVVYAYGPGAGVVDSTAVALPSTQTSTLPSPATSALTPVTPGPKSQLR
ncbi:hypothetical protein GCM10010377_64290 [Streptomyces viridiviolaceus]|nr:hypothetical protein GCM10010377_64290 [Streptomyces viridiviolaceus]